MMALGCGLLGLSLLTGCGMDTQHASANVSYKETKSMLLDILKSEEGQKAITAAQVAKPSKLLQGTDGALIRVAVKDVMTDPKYPDALKSIMTDPQFAAAFAKAIEKQQKDMYKDMLKDPAYQALLLGVMKDKEFEQILIEVLRGKTYRKEAMQIFQDALKVPAFQVELVKLFMKAKTEQSSAG